MADSNKGLNERKGVVRKILRELQRRGWSQKKFSLVWGRPESQVSKLLSGKVDMQLSTIVEIEQILDIEIINREGD